MQVPYCHILICKSRLKGERYFAVRRLLIAAVSRRAEDSGMALAVRMMSRESASLAAIGMNRAGFAGGSTLSKVGASGKPGAVQSGSRQVWGGGIEPRPARHREFGMRHSYFA
ncbi:hypothetical protein LMG27198_32590 [Methylocystis echinoides]|uniref:Uncharacterized protein n=1 Tax=Methylocystis echinoides TaxID=29468 RepID=A0A9W6LT87_9HYPH|nr:hypothetical protein LMG27198_32590 [Methylocystis echinoides]